MKSVGCLEIVICLQFSGVGCKRFSVYRLLFICFRKRILRSGTLPVAVKKVDSSCCLKQSYGSTSEEQQIQKYSPNYRIRTNIPSID